jgi:V/A-type H+-transporting ATPase subunit E
MSSKELIESLRRSGDEKIRLLRQEAEQEAGAVRTTATARIEGLRKRYADQLSAATGEETIRALAEAANRARALKLAAEKVLSERLLSSSRAALQQLRGATYPAIFEKMVLELPSLAWNLVRVHPADVNLARKYFPEAEIVPVETITGGIDVTIRDGTIRVINTLEKRLERAWNELLPPMVKDAYREISDGASSETR